MQELDNVNLSPERKKAIVIERKILVDKFFDDLANADSTLYHMFRTQKKEMFNYVAEQMEIIYKFEDRRINTIANDILKELRNRKAVDEDYTYVYDVLPACYKSHAHNPDDPFSESREQTSSESPDTTHENRRIIDILVDAQELCKELTDDLKVNHLMDNLSAEDLLDFEEFSGKYYAASTHLKAVKDKRTAVSPQHKGQYYVTFLEATENECSKLFFKHARQLEEISGKQSHNILFGLVTDVPFLYEPSNMQEAMRAGFVGSQCRDPKRKGCESWRVKVYKNPETKRYMFYCHHCKEWFNIAKILLPGPAEKEKRSVQLNVVTLQAPNTMTATVNTSW